MPVQRLSQRHVGAGVETLGELVALVIQVGIHGEALVGLAVWAKRVLVALGLDSEALVDFLLTAVGQVRDAAGRREALARGLVVFVVVAAVPERIALNRRDLRGLDADLPCGSAGRHRDDTGRGEKLRMQQAPLQSAGAAHGAADDGVDVLEPQLLQELMLGFDEIADGQRRKARAPGLAV